MKPLPVLDVIGRSLDPDLHISSLVIKPARVTSQPVEDETNVDGETGVVSEAFAPLNKIPPATFEIVVKIIFPGELGPEKGITETNAYEARLKKNLPNHEIKIMKQVADLSYTGNFVGEVGSQSDPNKPVEDFEAEIMIKGALQ